MEKTPPRLQEIRMEIEAELEKMGIDYKTISSFNPEKITVEWKK